LANYDGSDYQKSESIKEAILIELARVVSSQVSSPQEQARGVEVCERLLDACDSSLSVKKLASGLSRTDHADLNSILDLTLRLGLLQFDRFCSDLNVYPHMYDSGILLEESPVLTRAGNTPGIFNAAVPSNIRAIYDAWNVLKELYTEKYMREISPGQDL
jgi:hypothetical protein